MRTGNFYEVGDDSLFSKHHGEGETQNSEGGCDGAAVPIEEMTPPIPPLIQLQDVVGEDDDGDTVRPPPTLSSSSAQEEDEGSASSEMPRRS